jgi:hypothetical protein
VSTTDGDGRSLLGLAHVASCSFLASRLAPSLQFWTALGGSIALARAAALHGVRAGYGASMAAIVQTVALIGPARINGPLTQALNAPVMGHMQAAGRPRVARLAAGTAIRLAHYAVMNVLFVVVVVGGLHEFVASYDKVADFLRVLPNGTGWAVGLTVAGSVVIALVYTTIQLVVYERAFARWPVHPPAHEVQPPDAAPVAERGRVPVVALVLTTLAWVALLASTAWTLLAVVGACLAVAIVVRRAWSAGRQVWSIGLALALVLAVGALIPAALGAVAFDGAARRAVRAALLVLSVTWLRAVAGAPGMRETARRSLRRVRRFPSAAEAAEITERLESDRRLVPAARAFLDEIKRVPQRPGPLIDALVAWVAAEAAGYRPPGVR